MLDQELHIGDFGSDVFEILTPDDVDVVIEQQPGQLIFRRSGRVSFLQSLLCVSCESPLKLGLVGPEAAVPVVLDRVVASPDQEVLELCPLVLFSFLQEEENPVFLDGPVYLLEEGVQLIVPALSALLPGSPGHLWSNVVPLERALLRDQLQQGVVLLLTPNLLMFLLGDSWRFLLHS